MTVAYRRPGMVPIDWSGVPAGFRGKVSAVVRNIRQAEDLVDFYGHPEWVPAAPVLVLIPGQRPTIVNGGGQATALQLRDIATELYVRELARVQKHRGEGRFDFHEWDRMSQRERLDTLDIGQLAHARDEVQNPAPAEWQHIPFRVNR